MEKKFTFVLKDYCINGEDLLCHKSVLMKKNAIIDLIENDLKEVQTLVETFREPERIAKAFIELLEQKHDSIGREIKLLNFWATENMEAKGAESVELAADIKVAPAKNISAPKAETKPAQQQEPKKSPSAEQSKTFIPQQPAKPAARKEENDYFADELANMPDPFADSTIKYEAPQPAVAKEEPQKEEPIPEPTKKQEPAKPADSPKPKVPVKPQPATKPRARNAAEIATYGTPVDDINKALGINDRFLFLRELFAGNKAAMDATLETINHSSSFEQAHIYLKQSFAWDETQSVVEAFMSAVHRRFL